MNKIITKYKKWKMDADDLMGIKVVRECPTNNVHPDDDPDPED